MSANPLAAASLAKHIAASLPHDASPQLKSPTDAIAIACHAGFVAVGFQLIGLAEDKNIHGVLPQDWNAASNVEFRYKHPQSSMQFLLQVSRLGAQTIITGVGVGDDKPVHLSITSADYVSTSSVPATPVSSTAEGTESGALEQITKIFITPARLTDLGANLRTQIIQRLIPSLQKDGYEESPQTTQAQSRVDSTRRVQPDGDRRREPPETGDEPPTHPHPLADPLAMARQPRRPGPVADFPPPGFEDEHQLQRPIRGPLGSGGPFNGGVAGYGERDLYPQGLGPNDPLRIGGIGPGLGGRPGGGMHPTFDDPMFGDRDGGDGGGYGFNPQAPPGARFDPVGPGGRPARDGRFGGANGLGGRGPSSNAPPNPFSGFGNGDFI